MGWKNLLISDSSLEISFPFGSWIKRLAACLAAADEGLSLCGLQVPSLPAVNLASYEMK